jgi:phospholipase D-like protein
VEKKSWNELSQRTRRMVVIGGAFEGLLKVAALIDVARRPSHQIRGSKPRWVAAIVLINSVGGAPIAYFAFGRRKD